MPRRCGNTPGRGRHLMRGIDMAQPTTTAADEPAGWVTFQTIRTANGVFLVQKRDGATRTIRGR